MTKQTGTPAAKKTVQAPEKQLAPEKDRNWYNDAASEILKRLGDNDKPSDIEEQLKKMDAFEIEWPDEDKGFAKKIRQKLAGK